MKELREEKQLKVAHQILGDYAQASINDANIKQLMKELTPVAEPVITTETKEFTKKLEKEIEELGDDTEWIIIMLQHYRNDLESQIEDTYNRSKIMVDEYERELRAEFDEKIIGLDENDEDDYDTILQLNLEIDINVGSMKGNEDARLAELNNTRDEKIAVICDMLEYYENL